MKVKAFLIAVFLFTWVHSYSQVSFKTEYIGNSSYWLDKGENPRERIGESKGSAVVYQGSIEIPLSVKKYGLSKF